MIMRPTDFGEQTQGTSFSPCAASDGLCDGSEKLMADSTWFSLLLSNSWVVGISGFSRQKCSQRRWEKSWEKEKNVAPTLNDSALLSALRELRNRLTKKLKTLRSVWRIFIYSAQFTSINCRLQKIIEVQFPDLIFCWKRSSIASQGACDLSRDKSNKNYTYFH